jgi:acetyl esterase/lipase
MLIEQQCWANIAFFFASQNIITILATHRLVPDVTYPGGADDIQHARDWIYANISDPKYGKGDAEKVILMGHSSGGAHIAMNLYSSGDPKRGGKDEIWPPVAGVVYLSTPFWFDMNKPVRKRVLEEYFGSDNVSVWGVSVLLESGDRAD